MKIYTTQSDKCWDDIAFELCGDEFRMMELIESQYSEEITTYLLLPKGKQIFVTEGILEASEGDLEPFKAPWE